MANTDIVISLPGSDIMPGVFLPPGAEMIVPCRLMSGGRWRKSLDIQLWFQYSHVIPTEYCEKIILASGMQGLSISSLMANVTAAIGRLRKKNILEFL